MDETGFAMGLAFSAKVVILRGRIINFKTVDGNREWVTQVDAIGMHGQTIPPFVIFKGRQHTDSLWETAEEAVGDCSIGMTENGWSNEEMGLKWLEHFERHTRRIEACEASKIEHHGYRLLIMDGHTSHTNIDFVEFCWNHKIIPICLPPHSTHFLQPLDLVIFSVLKRLYSAKVDEYAARGITGINRGYFLRILGEIRPYIYTPELINSAFEAAGLLPFNPSRVLQRLTKGPSTRPTTPLSDELTILSSPLHPKTPKSYSDRARYGHTICHLDTLPEAVDAVVKKLISHMDSLEEGIEILQQENTELRNGAAERRAKKKKKRIVLSTQSVLTTESARALIAARVAVVETKQQAKDTRERLRKNKRDAAIVAQAQVQKRKEARAIAKIAKGVADQHKRKLGDAERSSKKAQTALTVATKAAIKMRTPGGYIAAAKAAKEVQSTAGALATLRKQWEDSSTTAAETVACSKALQDTARALKKDSRQAIQPTQEEDEEEEGLDGSSSDEVSDEDDFEMDDVGLIEEESASVTP